MNAKKIIFPTDFSPASDAAMTHATSLAKDMGAKLLIVHVVEPPQAYGGGDFYYGAAEPDTEQLQEMLEALQPTEVPFEHLLLSGDPARAIVDLAEAEQADLIVMGTHGRTGLMRLLMGSVTEAVVRRAPCPLFTYRQPKNVAAAV